MNFNSVGDEVSLEKWLATEHKQKELGELLGEYLLKGTN